MQRTDRTVSCWAALALASGLEAQTVWIVDAQQGPGSHFKDLPQAVAAAAPGDIVLLRATGGYSGTTLARGISILGAQPGLPIGPGITIQQLPAGERVVLKNLAFNSYHYGAQTYYSTVACTGCSGSIHLQNVQAQGNAVAPALSIQDCRHVTIGDSTFASGSISLLGAGYTKCVSLSNSSVSFSRCWLSGILNDMGAAKSTIVGTIHNSAVTFTDTAALGGPTVCTYYFQTVYCTPLQTARDAFTVTASRIHVSGASDIRGGTNKIYCYDLLACTDPPTWGFATDSATVIVRDPRSKATQSGGVEVVRPLADLDATSAPPAATARVNLRYAGTAFYWLAIGRPAPISNAALDPGIWLDTRDFLVADWGTLAGSKTVSLPVPPTIPRGFVVTLQLMLAVGSTGELSLPATLVID